jgi:hypothetical protein
MTRIQAFGILAAILVATGVLTAAKPQAKLPPLGFYLGGIKPWGQPQASDFSTTIALSGSRGETLNFLLKTSLVECAKPELKTSTPFSAKFYEVLPFITKNASYPGATPGTYWDAVIPRQEICPAQGGGWILGELKIPMDARPGQITASIQVGKVSIPLQLKVWNLTLPEQPATPLYSGLITWFLIKGHYGQWHEGEAQLGRKYIADMLEHQMAPLSPWVRNIELGPEMAKLKTVNGASSPDSFLATTVEPLPAWAKIPVPFDSNLDPDSPKTVEFITKVHAALKHEGWLERSFAYLWDEPKASDMPRLRKLALLVRKHAPGLKILVTMTPTPEFEELVDIWVPNMDEFDRPGRPLPAAYSELQKKGKEVWLYASCMSHGCTSAFDSGSPDWVIDRPGTHIRSQGWIAQKYHLNALLYYSVVDSYQHFSKDRDPWTDLWDFTGNGDGTLYYPGRPGLHGLKENGPVETLRLKLWRQSSYDSDYVEMLSRSATKPAWWPGKLDSLVRSVRDWEHADSAYRTVREQIGDYLDQQAHSSGEKK